MTGVPVNGPWSTFLNNVREVNLLFISPANALYYNGSISMDIKENFKRYF